MMYSLVLNIQTNTSSPICRVRELTKWTSSRDLGTCSPAVTCHKIIKCLLNSTSQTTELQSRLMGEGVYLIAFSGLALLAEDVRQDSQRYCSARNNSTSLQPSWFQCLCQMTHPHSWVADHEVGYCNRSSTRNQHRIPRYCSLLSSCWQPTEWLLLITARHQSLPHIACHPGGLSKPELVSGQIPKPHFCHSLIRDTACRHHNFPVLKETLLLLLQSLFWYCWPLQI